MPSTTSSSPLTRSTLVVPRQEASPFRSCCVCASLLKATLFPCVCTQILLLPLTLCSRAVVFEPSWPLDCTKQLVLFLFVELCCDISPQVTDLDRVPCVYDYYTRSDFGGVISWYQSRLPVGHPIPTPWSKSSLVFAKLLY